MLINILFTYYCFKQVNIIFDDHKNDMENSHLFSV